MSAPTPLTADDEILIRRQYYEVGMPLARLMRDWKVSEIKLNKILGRSSPREIIEKLEANRKSIPELLAIWDKATKAQQ
tara:strand:+ start:4033 stop:4269 length:237 start_codon:yes stop_codon:yes gene_type:complete